MPFQRGHQKQGGRGPGVPNKVTIEVRALARQLVEDPRYQERLRERLRAGKAGTMEALLWQYAYGKPTEPAEGGIDLGRMLEEIARRRLEMRDPRGPRPKLIDGRDEIGESSDKSTAS